MGMALGLGKDWINQENIEFNSIDATLWQQKTKDKKLLKEPRILRSDLIYGFKINRYQCLEIGAALNY